MEDFDLDEKECHIRALIAVTQDGQMQYVGLPEDGLLREQREHGHLEEEMLHDVEVPDKPGLYYFEAIHYVEKYMTSMGWEWDSGNHHARWSKQSIPHIDDVSFHAVHDTTK